MSTKLLGFTSSWRKVNSLHQREPFAFMEGVIPLRYDEGHIKRFVSSTSTWENLVQFFEIARHVFPHQHTLVSLKELGEKDAKILTDRASTGTWRFLERLFWRV